MMFILDQFGSKLYFVENIVDFLTTDNAAEGAALGWGDGDDSHEDDTECEWSHVDLVLEPAELMRS